MTTPTATQHQQQHIIPPSLTWLTIFVPALAYFITSRFALTGELGIPVQQVLAPITTNKHVSPILASSSMIMLVQSNLTDITSTIWMHQSDLGRGFLLLSSSTNSGRVWRWERGGGPIPIGKSLFLEKSGCRSNKNKCHEKYSGSGAMAIDFTKKETSLEGRLILAEWGEQRIVRLEDSGVRTPLILEIPTSQICDTTTIATTTTRIHQPTSMIMTPFGDLIVVEYSPHCGVHVIWKLTAAMQIPPLVSTWESRLAHKWNKVQHNHSIQLLMTKSLIGGIALDATWEGLFTVIKDEGKVQLVNIPLVMEDQDNHQAPPGPKHLLDLSSYTSQPGPIVLDKNQHVYIGIDDGVLIVSPAPHMVLGQWSLPERPVSLTVGDDGYFYMASTTNLYRIKVTHGPLTVPTNLIKVQ